MRIPPGVAVVAIAASSLAAACSDRALPTKPVTVTGVSGTAGGAAGMGGAGAGGVDPGAPAGVLGWAIPVGTQAEPAVPGSTAVTAVVGAEDGGTIVAGSYKGRIRFAPDYVLDSGRRAGFVARYRSDQRFVWERVLFSADGDVVIADAALVGGGEVVVVGWFGGTLIVGQDDTQVRVTSAGALDLFAARFAGDGCWTERRHAVARKPRRDGGYRPRAVECVVPLDAVDMNVDETGDNIAVLDIDDSRMRRSPARALDC